MAYLHCHSCDWGQDDFWSLRFRFRWKKFSKSWWKLGLDFGYNPISKIINDIKWLWRPRWFSLDTCIVAELIEYTGVNVWVRKRKRLIIVPDVKGVMNVPAVWDGPTKEREVTERVVFSWQWLLLEFVKEWKNFRKMKWWTWDQWKNDRETAVCPKCGDRNFDID